MKLNILTKRNFKKMVLVGLSSTLLLCGCKAPLVSEEVKITSDDKIESGTEETLTPIISDEAAHLEKHKTSDLEQPRSLEDAALENYLLVTLKTELKKEPNLESESLDEVNIGDRFENYEVLDGFYKVNKDGNIAYINSSCAKEKVDYIFPYEFKKVAYITQDKELFDSETLDYSSILLKTRECLEIYEEYEDSYLVKTNDYAGYVSKEYLEELTGTFVIVDISDQNLKMYKNNEIALETPVVTGKVSRSTGKSITNEGVFDVYNITTDRYLTGPGYRSYVNVMMKFDENIGLHDAEYYTDPNGKKHGWREYSEFGGETYITNGSHGCVNMPHDAAIDVYNNVEIGTKVVVKL